MRTERLPLPQWRFLASFSFWCRVVLETVGACRFSRVLERRLRGRAIMASGTESVPPRGGVVFAVNHYHAGLTLDVVGAALASASRSRPGVRDACTVIVGQRRSTLPPSRWRTLVRWAAARFFERWDANVLRIPTGRGAAGIAHLRAWRRRAARGPILVFPEGVANGELESVREGAGRWLASLGVPVVPVGVWWDEARWNVVFGLPVAWSPRHELRDAQLGLAMAALLPAEVAPAWAGALAKWRAAHASPARPRRDAA